MNRAASNHKRKANVPPRTDAADATLSPIKIIKSLLISIGIGAACAVIGAMIAYFSPDPNRLIPIIGLFGTGITALLGGLVATRLQGHSALLSGLINGCLLTALMLLLSPMMKSRASGYTGTVSALLHTAFLLLSVAGGYLGLRQKPKKKKKRN